MTTNIVYALCIRTYKLLSCDTTLLEQRARELTFARLSGISDAVRVLLVDREVLSDIRRKVRQTEDRRDQFARRCA